MTDDLAARQRAALDRLRPATERAAAAERRQLAADLAEFAAAAATVCEMTHTALNAPALIGDYLRPADIHAQTWEHLRQAHQLLGEILRRTPR